MASTSSTSCMSSSSSALPPSIMGSGSAADTAGSRWLRLAALKASMLGVRSDALPRAKLTSLSDSAALGWGVGMACAADSVCCSTWEDPDLCGVGPCWTAAALRAALLLRHMRHMSWSSSMSLWMASRSTRTRPTSRWCAVLTRRTRSRLPRSLDSTSPSSAGTAAACSTSVSRDSCPHTSPSAASSMNSSQGSSSMPRWLGGPVRLGVVGISTSQSLSACPCRWWCRSREPGSPPPCTCRSWCAPSALGGWLPRLGRCCWDGGAGGW
mmetsp:Transcript_6717/g.16707  ORF Transcript_6717/g.16707 Transcript_6717/m.16707 type:complete len:268 (-) Transcript_6717:701-1504(-)